MASFISTGDITSPHLTNRVRAYEGVMASSTSDPERRERSVSPDSGNREVSGRVCVAC